MEAASDAGGGDAGGGGKGLWRRWATPAAMMVEFKTAGALDGAQVERRVAPLLSRAVACARGRVAGSAWCERWSAYGARKQCTWAPTRHDVGAGAAGAGRKHMWSDAHDGALLHILGVVGTRLRKAAGVCDTVLDKASRACRAGPSPTFETPVLCLGLVPRYSIRRSKKLSVQKRGRGKKQGCSMQLQHLQIRTQAKLQRRPPLQIHRRIELLPGR